MVSGDDSLHVEAFRRHVKSRRNLLLLIFRLVTPTMVAMRVTLVATIGCCAAVLVPAASAGAHYLAMRNPALVAKSYQHYLNSHGFRERCWANGRYLVSCRGRTLTNDPAQPWHPWSTQIRKLSRSTAERRIWMDGQPVGGPMADKRFVRYFHILGWN